MVPSTAKWSFCVQLATGLILGAAIGWNSPTVQYLSDIGKCDIYATESSCSSANGYTGFCVWSPVANPNASTQAPSLMAGNAGGVAVQHVPSSFVGLLALSDDNATYACTSTSGDPVILSTQLQALLSAILIIGTLPGVLLSPWTLRHGPRFGCRLGCVFFILGTAIITGSWQAKIAKAGVYIGRFFQGVSMGLLSNCGPSYNSNIVDEPNLRKTVGVFFQIGCTLGILLCALFGIICDPGRADATAADFVSRYQIFFAFDWIVGIAAMAITVLCPEKAHDGEDESSAINNEDGGAGNGRPAVKLLVVAAVLSAAQQLTGINAIMNYATKMATSVGIPNAYVGNAAIMAWNFVTTLASIKLATVLKPTKSFVYGTMGAALSCALTGAVMYPGAVKQEGVVTALGCIGIALFIAFFEMAMAPFFYMLAQELFEEGAERKFGSTFTNFVALVLNLVINYGYPVSVKGLSPDDDKNHKEGGAIVNFIFAGIGLLSAVFLFFNMKQREEEDLGEETRLSEKK